MRKLPDRIVDAEFIVDFEPAELAPTAMVVASPNALTVVAVVLMRLKLDWSVDRVPPIILTSLSVSFRILVVSLSIMEPFVSVILPPPTLKSPWIDTSFPAKVVPSTSTLPRVLDIVRF